MSSEFQDTSATFHHTLKNNPKKLSKLSEGEQIMLQELSGDNTDMRLGVKGYVWHLYRIVCNIHRLNY